MLTSSGHPLDTSARIFAADFASHPKSARNTSYKYRHNWQRAITAVDSFSTYWLKKASFLNSSRTSWYLSQYRRADSGSKQHTASTSEIFVSILATIKPNNLINTPEYSL